MGTIASVLQWTCTNCNLINPTECLKCLQCGNIRRILESVDSGGVYGEDEGSGGGGGDDDGNANDGLRCGGGACSTIDRITKCDNSRYRAKHKTLPGYVEISSNG